MTSLKMFQVDAFTDQLFKGNPAAVVLVEDSLSDEVMQKIAAENNLAETAFVKIEPQTCQLRWFTPETEVPLCGHATLATAHVLFTENFTAQNKVCFETLSGPLTVTQEPKGYQMDFPAYDFEVVSLPEVILRRLGFEPIEAFKVLDEWIVVTTEDNVCGFDQAFNDLAGLGNAVVLTACSQQEEFDVVSRVFGLQGLGIEEDPVTGAAHCWIVKYWANALGRNRMNCLQASHRSGSLVLELENNRAKLKGEAKTFFKGEITL